MTDKRIYVCTACGMECDDDGLDEGLDYREIVFNDGMEQICSECSPDYEESERGLVVPRRDLMRDFAEGESMDSGNICNSEYYAFVLGYDLLQKHFTTMELTCDEAYELAHKIVAKFVKSKHFNRYELSTYDALQEFLADLENEEVNV